MAFKPGHNITSTVQPLQQSVTMISCDLDTTPLWMQPKIALIFFFLAVAAHCWFMFKSVVYQDNHILLASAKSEITYFEPVHLVFPIEVQNLIFLSGVLTFL